MSEIPRLKAGGRPTFLEAEFANRVIDALNGIRRGRIVPQGSGTIKAGAADFLIDLSPLVDQIQKLARGTNAASIINITNITNEITEINIQITNINNKLNGIIGALNGAQIECDPNDSHITLTFPGLPSAGGQ